MLKSVKYGMAMVAGLNACNREKGVEFILQDEKGQKMDPIHLNSLWV